jgi:anti-sigma regulatory factor (Ser/Thr protein kinase)
MPGGRVAVAVGDVVGHGVEAAAVMAQLRTALRAYAADGHAPAMVVGRVNGLMWHLGPLAMTTLVYAVLDPADESLELVSAGHPPALLIDPAGGAQFLDVDGGVALGATQASTYRSERFGLSAGTTLFAYTDGLVERRGESLDAGLERLRTIAQGAIGADALCSAVLDGLVRDAPADDVAFIAARVPPVGDRLSTRWPAAPSSLATIRSVLRRWLAGLGADDDEAYDIVVACQEACANAIEHAYGPGRAEIGVDATHAAGTVTVTVRDRGRWRPPRGENRGRGLELMGVLMDTVDVRHDVGGTAVELTRRIGV